MRLTIHVYGRPAPQGSHALGGAGQFLDASPYLPAWRQAVIVGAYRAYAAARIPREALPIFPAGTPVAFERITFRLIRGEQGGSAEAPMPTGDPDIDKLLRATLDALGGRRDKRRTARLYADDAQVIGLNDVTKVWAPTAMQAGATIIISDGRD